MTFFRGALVCIHRIPHKQDVSVLVKRCAKMTTMEDPVHELTCSEFPWVWGCGTALWCADIYSLYFFCLRWEGWYYVSFFSYHCCCQRMFSVFTLWNMRSLKCYWFSVVWLPQAFLCLFFLAPSCIFFFLVLRISISVHSFPSCLLFFKYFLLKFGKLLFLDNKR